MKILFCLILICLNLKNCAKYSVRLSEKINKPPHHERCGVNRYYGTFSASPRSMVTLPVTSNGIRITIVGAVSAETGLVWIGIHLATGISPISFSVRAVPSRSSYFASSFAGIGQHSPIVPLSRYSPGLTSYSTSSSGMLCKICIQLLIYFVFFCIYVIIFYIFIGENDE